MATDPTPPSLLASPFSRGSTPLLRPSPVRRDAAARHAARRALAASPSSGSLASPLPQDLRGAHLEVELNTQIPERRLHGCHTALRGVAVAVSKEQAQTKLSQLLSHVKGAFLSAADAEDVNDFTVDLTNNVVSWTLNNVKVRIDLRNDAQLLERLELLQRAGRELGALQDREYLAEVRTLIAQMRTIFKENLLDGEEIKPSEFTQGIPTLYCGESLRTLRDGLDPKFTSLDFRHSIPEEETERKTRHLLFLQALYDYRMELTPPADAAPGAPVPTRGLSSQEINQRLQAMMSLELHVASTRIRLAREKEILEVRIENLEKRPNDGIEAQKNTLETQGKALKAHEKELTKLEKQLAKTEAQLRKVQADSATPQPAAQQARLAQETGRLTQERVRLNRELVQKGQEVAGLLETIRERKEQITRQEQEVTQLKEEALAIDAKLTEFSQINWFALQAAIMAHPTLDHTAELEDVQRAANTLLEKVKRDGTAEAAQETRLKKSGWKSIKTRWSDDIKMDEKYPALVAGLLFVGMEDSLAAREAYQNFCQNHGIEEPETSLEHLLMRYVLLGDPAPDAWAQEWQGHFAGYHASWLQTAGALEAIRASDYWDAIIPLEEHVPAPRAPAERRRRKEALVVYMEATRTRFLTGIEILQPLEVVPDRLAPPTPGRLQRIANVFRRTRPQVQPPVAPAVAQQQAPAQGRPLEDNERLIPIDNADLRNQHLGVVLPEDLGVVLPEDDDEMPGLAPPEDGHNMLDDLEADSDLEDEVRFPPRAGLQQRGSGEPSPAASLGAPPGSRASLAEETDDDEDEAPMRRAVGTPVGGPQGVAAAAAAAADGDDD